MQSPLPQLMLSGAQAALEFATVPLYSSRTASPPKVLMQTSSFTMMWISETSWVKSRSGASFHFWLVKYTSVHVCHNIQMGLWYHWFIRFYFRLSQVYDGYFVHYFAPRGLPVVPKDVIFVIDVSGSMIGTKIKQVEWTNFMDSLWLELQF